MQKRKKKHKATMAGISVDNTPLVPHNIMESRIANFMSSKSIFYRMGIHRGLWTQRHSGSPHVDISVYSVPDLNVSD